MQCDQKRARYLVAAAKASCLAPRQLDVLKGTACGLNVKQIAVSLGVSHKTVEWHKAKLKQSLGIQGDANLTRFAIRAGLIEA